MRPSSYFLIVVILLMIALISWSLTYPDIETTILPLMFSAVTLVLATVQIVIENRNGKILKSAGAKDNRDVEQIKQSHASVAGWLIGLLCGVYILGLLIATTLFVCLYIKLRGRGWGIAIILAAMFLSFSYVLFVLVLHIHLYKGLLFTL